MLMRYNAVCQISKNVKKNLDDCNSTRYTQAVRFSYWHYLADISKVFDVSSMVYTF